MNNNDVNQITDGDACGRRDDDHRRRGYFDQMLKSSPEIILFLDRDGGVNFCTDTFLRVAHIDDFSAIRGRSYQYIYSLRGNEALVRQAVGRFELAKRLLRTVTHETKIDFSGEGVTRVYDVQATPTLDADGNFDGVIVMYYDTTELRATEADEYTRIMLDATPLACSLWDENDGLLDCNREALRMFGLRHKSDYLRYIDDLSPLFQPDGSRSRDRALAYDTAAIKRGYQRFEWMHRTLSGEPLPVETTLVRVPWKDGYRLATYSRDLRNIKASQRLAQTADARSRELEIRTRAAQVASAAKSRFLAAMSHEIRTPMNAVIGMSNLMRVDNLDAVQRAYIDDIRQTLRSLHQIINDILDFSRIEAGKLHIEPTHFNLTELFDNICSMSRYLADAKELKFIYSFGADVPHVVFGDDVRVRQVLVNIINNAIKYTREGEVTFRVRLTEKAGRAYTAFTVSDTGIGIKAEDIPYLFNAFEQFDADKNRGVVGAGLGLSITKNLVTLMDGEIEVTSEYGTGSAFTVLLPLPEGDPHRVNPHADIDYAIAKPGVRVLVAEDNNTNLKIAVAYLARHGISPDTAGDGLSAYKMITDKATAGEPYDLIFMDHMMPGMDGAEVTRRLRAEGYIRTPVIALTANAVEDARELFRNAGMNDFVPKPIDPKDLNAALLRWLPAGMVERATPPDPTGRGTVRGAAASEGGNAATSGGHGATGETHLTAGGRIDGRYAARGHEVAIDVTAGLKNAVGDSALYARLLLDFLNDHALDHRRIADAIADGGVADAHRYAHTLKSTAALIGAERLRGVAMNIEHLLADGRGSLAEERLGVLDTELTAVVDLLERILPELTANGGDDTAYSPPPV